MHGHPRQIPIASLNVKQVEENKMPIGMNKWFYHLSTEQLKPINFTCNNQAEFDEQFGQDPELARPDMNAFANQVDQHMDDEEQPPQASALQVESNNRYNNKITA